MPVSRLESTLCPKSKRVIICPIRGTVPVGIFFCYSLPFHQRMGDLPESIRKTGKRLTGMTSGQDKFPLDLPRPKVSRIHGKNGRMG